MLFWPTLIFIATFVGSLALLVAIIAILPADYFASSQRSFLADQPPLVRWSGLIGKNVLGIALIGLGIVLSLPLMPGQGLLTIAIGLILVDVPGKHHLTRRIVQRPGVLKSLNRVRAWFKRPPFVSEG